MAFVGGAAQETLSLPDGRSMRVVQAFPPNIAEIEEAVPGVRGMAGVVFGYGQTLYNPYAGKIEKWLLAHELVHTAQQGNAVDAWWRRYLNDIGFRFEQEVAAHQAEYQMMRSCVRDPDVRAIWVRDIAEKLTRPVYGSLISYGDALRLIRGKK